MFPSWVLHDVKPFEGEGNSHYHCLQLLVHAAGRLAVT
jgi:hypothetical protein